MCYTDTCNGYTRRRFDNLQVRVARTGTVCYTHPCDGYTRRRFDNLQVQAVRIGNSACYIDPSPTVGLTYADAVTELESRNVSIVSFN